MIYKFYIKNDDNINKLFYLTADTQSQLIRRIASTYGVAKDKITILAEYETDGDSYKLKKSYETKVPKKDQKIIDNASKIFGKSRKLTGDSKIDYIKRMNFTEIDVQNETDLYPLLKKYKKVKVYFESTDKRGVYRYYALCK